MRVAVKRTRPSPRHCSKTWAKCLDGCWWYRALGPCRAARVCLSSGVCQVSSSFFLLISPVMMAPFALEPRHWGTGNTNSRVILPGAGCVGNGTSLNHLPVHGNILWLEALEKQ